VLNQDGQCIILNNTARHFLGLPGSIDEQLPHLDSFLRRFPVRSLHGRPIPPEVFPLARALRGESVRSERFITERADGSERMVEINVAPLFDGEARQIGVVGAFRDVTEQVRVEKRIRRALDTMLHAAEAVSGLTDIKEILQRVLAMTLTALNCERGAVQTYNAELQEFTPLLSIGFTEAGEARWFEEQTTWLAPGENHYCGFRNQILEGHAALVNAEQCPEFAHLFQDTMILAAPIIHNNTVLGVMLLDRSRKLRKERKRPPGATRLLVNPAFNIWDMAVVEGIAQFAGLAIEQARWQQEAEIARSNEEIMRRSNALKDEFLAITAHEFRTPLTVILAHSQIMLRTLGRTTNLDAKLHDQFHDSLSTIEVQTHQLTNIVNTFLEVTRLNRGQIALKEEEIDLEKTVKQVINNHAPTSPSHQIVCQVAPGERPYMVKGDEVRLLQIFGNLLQNAIKYSPFGGQITISLAQIVGDDGKPLIELRVQDQGIGIPAEALPRLFERFYRAPNTEGSGTRGVGLGLYVVAEFVRLHGGTIRAESSGVVGEGSCFILTLPRLE
jgi:signal transduction histidine kinase